MRFALSSAAPMAFACFSDKNICHVAVKQTFGLLSWIGPDMIYERTTTLMEAELGDELVGLEPNAGLCFGFNDVAKRVWQLLAVPRSVDEIRSTLLKEYDVAPDQCEADLSELLDDLVKKQLISCH